MSDVCSWSRSFKRYTENEEKKTWNGSATRESGDERTESEGLTVVRELNASASVHHELSRQYCSPPCFLAPFLPFPLSVPCYPVLTRVLPPPSPGPGRDSVASRLKQRRRRRKGYL